MRRFGEHFRSDQNYRPRPGAYGFLVDGEMALLTQQMDNNLPEVQFPGGGIDPGESPIQALHRECLEETGWRVAVERRLGAYRRFVYMPEYEMWAEKICHIYLARPIIQITEPSEPDHETLWMPIDVAAQELYSPGDRAFVAGYLKSLRNRWS